MAKCQNKQLWLACLMYSQVLNLQNCVLTSITVHLTHIIGQALPSAHITTISTLDQQSKELKMSNMTLMLSAVLGRYVLPSLAR